MQIGSHALSRRFVERLKIPDDPLKCGIRQLRFQVADVLTDEYLATHGKTETITSQNSSQNESILTLDLKASIVGMGINLSRHSLSISPIQDPNIMAGTTETSIPIP